MRKTKFWQRIAAAALSAALITSAPVSAFEDAGMIDLSGTEAVGTADWVENLAEDPGEDFPDSLEEDEVMAAAAGSEIQQITTHHSYTYYHPLRQTEAPWATAKIGGKLAYCVDMANFHTNSGVSMNSSTEYPGLTTEQKYVVGHIMQYGAKDDGNIPFHMATQTLIWEAIHGRMDLEILSRTGDDIYNGVIGYNPAAAIYYDQILTAVRNHEQVPSFMGKWESSAPSHQASGTDGSYEVKLENTNTACNLAEFHFSSDGNVEFSIDGQTLTIRSDSEIIMPLMVRAYKNADRQTDSLLFWSSGDNVQQVRSTPLDTNPVPAFLKLATTETPAEPEEPDEPDEPEYWIEIHKVQEGTDKPLAGAVFEVRHTEKGIVGSITSDAEGTASIQVPWPGSYILTEITPPENHLLDENPMKDVVVNTDNPEASVTFVNRPYTGLLVRKVDAGDGKPLAGAVIEIQQIDGDIALTETTDRNGEAHFDSLPPNTSWRIKEVQAPEGYHLNEETFTAQLIDGQAATVAIPDKIKTGLVIRKVDAETGEPLAGAVFTVTRPSGEMVGEYITGQNGLVVIESLTEGAYVVTEIQPPEGYLLDGDNARKTVNLSWETSQELVFRDFAKPRLLLKKIDGDTGEPLAGAVIRVAKRGGTAYTDITTGADGTAVLEDLDPDWYQVREIRSPSGYLLDDTIHDIQLVSGEAVLVLKNSQRPSLTIQKIDSVTKQPMKGVKFAISVKNGKDLGEFITDADGEIFLSGLECDLEAGTVLVVKEVSTLDGYLLDSQEKEVLLEGNKAASVSFENRPLNPILIKKVDQDGKPLAGVKFRVKRADGQYVGEFVTGISGLATVAGQQPGFFIIEEIETLDGYILDSTPKTVELRIDKPAEVEFINHKAASLLIKKVNSVDGSALAGATFKVTTAEGTLIGEVTSDQNGCAILSNLAPGTYIVAEIKGPKGFILDNTPHTVVVKKNEIATVEIANTPMSSLEIQKVDAVTGRPLSGVTFLVEKLSGEKIGSFTTDVNGRIILPNLLPQWLVVRETATRKGYKLDPTPVNVEVKPGKTTVVKLKNQPYPILDLLKIDAETNRPLAGAQFRLLDSQKREIGVFATNDQGRVTLTGLEGGQTVYLQETEAPKGYVLDETLRRVTLEWGKTSKITVKNDRIYGQLEILKIAADGSDLAKVQAGEPLSGAVFEIYDAKGKLVETLITDENGRARSKPLPLGSYTGKEVAAPEFFLLNKQEFAFEVTEQDQVFKVTVKDESKKPEVTIEKRGNVEAQPGQTMQYTLSDIRNSSNCPLDNFWVEDVLPTDAVRISKIHTGTFNEILTYKVTYQTNLASRYRVLADNLSTQISHDISCAIPGLAANEYITAVRFEFGTVQEGFASLENPVLEVNVLPDLADGYRIVNTATVSGECDSIPVYDSSTWVTVTFATPDRPLPRTGAVPARPIRTERLRKNAAVAARYRSVSEFFSIPKICNVIPCATFQKSGAHSAPKLWDVGVR